MVSSVWSGQIMEHLIGAVRNEKISTGVLVFLLMFAWWAYGWAEAEFVKKPEFANLQTAVNEGFESNEINNAGQIIRDVKLEILITKAANGSKKELADLDDELDHAEAYKHCLVQRQPNCRHLKDVE